MRKSITVGGLGLLAAAVLAGCGGGADGASETATAAPGTPAAANAMDTAAAPAAGTVSAVVAEQTDPGPAPVTVGDIREASGDEAPEEARARVGAAIEAGRVNTENTVSTPAQ